MLTVHSLTHSQYIYTYIRVYRYTNAHKVKGGQEEEVKGENDDK